jgi:uncharacterized protein YlxP (DUF503 family)
MPAIGVLTLEIQVDHSHSLKEKRNVVKSLKDRLRERFNIAIAEVDGLDSRQRSVVAAVTVSNDRVRAEQVLNAVEEHAAQVLGGSLASAQVEWLE